MSYAFRTEDEAIAADHAVFSFTGPHTHKEHPRDEAGEFTGETAVFQDRWGNDFVDFVTVEVPCEGCWL